VPRPLPRYLNQQLQALEDAKKMRRVVIESDDDEPVVGVTQRKA
jgi:hypothetical protein